MKFALLGADLQALQLAAAVAGSHEHELISAHDVGQAAAAVRAIAPLAPIVEHWEELLGGSQAEAVIVGRGADDDVRADQLRKLVQAGVPLVISHPVHDSMLVYYELDMIRQESKCLMLPYTASLGHPALARLTGLLQNGDETTEETTLGPLEQLVIERAMPERTRRAVQASFVRDMELARGFCGKLNKVAAMISPAPGVAGAGKSTGELNYANLGVQMSGADGVLVRWSVGPVEQRSGAKWTFVGPQGKATLEISDDDPRWKLETRSERGVESQIFEPWDAPAFALHMLEAARLGAPLVPEWLDAANTMELADAVEHSLERGRTIELHYEAPSEHSTFKGLMSGLGCFLLIGVLVLVVVATTAVHFGVPLADYWPHALLALLLSFLLLQLLRLAFPHSAD
jgi:myo-inositol 2-dehydrogenase/D-chiro-inositol 1-dehydrogenase